MGNIATGKHELRQPRRRSIRLKEYDYSEPGAYFVTICVKGRTCALAAVRNGNVKLSQVGHIVSKCWVDIPNHFPSVDLDAFVIMPNHLHGIVVLEDCRGVQLNAPTLRSVASRAKIHPDSHSLISPKRNTLSLIIRTFKAAVTRQCRQDGHHHFAWQRNYYEHIIRNQDKLNRIREYILYNPVHWDSDRENPERIPDNRYNNQWGDVFETVYGRTEQ